MRVRYNDVIQREWRLLYVF